MQNTERKDDAAEEGGTSALIQAELQASPPPPLGVCILKIMRMAQVRDKD